MDNHCIATYLVALLLILFELLLKLELGIELFDLGHLGIIPLPIVGLQNLKLLGRASLQSLYAEPTAFLVLNICSNLACNIGS